LATLLLLARLLIWILIHLLSFPNTDSKRTSDFARPMAKDNALTNFLFRNPRTSLKKSHGER